VLVIDRDDEGGSTDADDVARLELNENKSGVDDRVPMLNHAAVEIGHQHMQAAVTLVVQVRFHRYRARGGFSL
jgi:hypothetical protein